MISLPFGTPLSQMFDLAGVDPAGPDPLNALRYATGLSLAQIVAKLPEQDRDTVLAGMEDPEGLVYDWNFWGRPNQMPPDDGWSTYALVSGRGFGKELCVDTLVPIPGAKKFKTMGEMKAGDKLFDETGKICRVREAHPVRIPERAFRLHFSDGQTVDAGADHLWVTWDQDAFETIDNRGRGGGTVQVFPKDWADIVRHKETDRNYRLWGYGDPNSFTYAGPRWSQPPRPRVRDTKQLFDDFQDGIFHHIPAVLKPIDREMYKIPRWEGMGPKKVGQWVAEGQRTVLPDQFVYGTYNDLCAALRPIMDAFGKRDEEDGYVTLTLPPTRLVSQIVEMLRSLGEIPTLLDDNTIYFCPTFRGLLWLYKEDDNAPFKARKGGLTARSRMITFIEEIEPKPMRCLTVDSPNSMYLVTEAMIPTHNTRAGSEWVHKKALQYPGCRITLVGRTSADIRDVIVDGDSGICNVGNPEDRAEYFKTQRRLVWPNGSIAVGFSAEEPDQLRGWQGHFAWGDEIAAWKHTVDDSGLTAWDNMVISTRLGDNPQVLVTTTPKRNQFMFDLLEMEKEEDDVIIVRGSTMENAGPLGAAYIKKMRERYEGTRLADQELYGLMLDKVEGALWDEILIRDTRLIVQAGKEPKPPLMVIAVDPSMAEDPTDDCGIIVAGATNHKRLEDREAWVLEDCSVNGPPSLWAQTVVDTWERYRCPVLVETNQGGAMAATIIHSINPEIPILDVRANVGKRLRAEPVTLKYDKEKVHHVNTLPELENEMTSWVPGETRKSPDRVDALVYAITALLIKPPKKLGQKKMRTRSSAHRRITKRKRPGEGGTGGWGIQ